MTNGIGDSVECNACDCAEWHTIDTVSFRVPVNVTFSYVWSTPKMAKLLVVIMFSNGQFIYYVATCIVCILYSYSCWVCVCSYVYWMFCICSYMVCSVHMFVFQYGRTALAEYCDYKSNQIKSNQCNLDSYIPCLFSDQIIQTQPMSAHITPSISISIQVIFIL